MFATLTGILPASFTIPKVTLPMFGFSIEDDELSNDFLECCLDPGLCELCE